MSIPALEAVLLPLTREAGKAIMDVYETTTRLLPKLISPLIVSLSRVWKVPFQISRLSPRSVHPRMRASDPRDSS